MLCLNGIFETAIETDKCAKNPCKRINTESKKKSSEKRTYTQKQVDEILKKCDEHRFGLYTRILLQMGLRCSELCGLMWEYIDFINCTMTISRACTEVAGVAMIDVPKNKKSRTLPIPYDLMERLKAARGTGYILQTDTGRYMTPAYYTKARHNPFFNELNIKPKLSPHELRHTCGTLLYDKTHDIYAVSKFLGHSNVAITIKLYVHDSPEMLRKALFATVTDKDDSAG